MAETPEGACAGEEWPLVRCYASTEPMSVPLQESSIETPDQQELYDIDL